MAPGGSVEVVHGDPREFPLRPCTVIVIFDVLLYLDEAEQGRLLDRAVAVLEPGGVLLLREADAGAGLAFQVTQWCEKIAGALRDDFGLPLHYHSAVHWMAELGKRGFTLDAEPMSNGTLFANVLYVARKGVISS